MLRSEASAVAFDFSGCLAVPLLDEPFAPLHKPRQTAPPSQSKVNRRSFAALRMTLLIEDRPGV